MKVFVYRNSTVEPFFSNFDSFFSGYGDISVLDPECDILVWFYIIPYNANIDELRSEVDSYISRLELLLANIPSNKPFYIFTLKDIYSLSRVTLDCNLSASISEYNDRLFQLASIHPNIKYVDFSEFIDEYPQRDLVDWRFYFLSQMPLNPRLVKDFQSWFTRIISQVNFNRKKCLVLDLDNTLWGGILGEDGYEGIKIGGDYPGNAYSFFQQGLLELSKEGVILSVCSKNNLSDVEEAWEKNPFILLNASNLASYRINWNNKADNIIEIANELNIGLDSIVFIDDNPTERELVKQLLPMVEVPDYPANPYELPVFYKYIVKHFFQVYSLTDEDRKKVEQYNANMLRVKEKSKFAKFEDYLKSLEIEIKVMDANNLTIPRIAQMTQKTNQFNLTTKRYTEEDIKLLLDNGWEIYCLSVKDKFGDNGITGAIFIDYQSVIPRFSNYLLSCRILGKNIEKVFINYILNKLKERGVERVTASYEQSQKNGQVANFYDAIGFSCIYHNNLVKEYSLDLSITEIKEFDFCKVID